MAVAAAEQNAAQSAARSAAALTLAVQAVATPPHRLLLRKQFAKRSSSLALVNEKSRISSTITHSMF